MREELIGMLCIALGYPSLAVIAHHRLAETTTYDIAHRAVGNRTTLAFLYLSYTLPSFSNISNQGPRGTL